MAFDEKRLIIDLKSKGVWTWYNRKCERFVHSANARAKALGVGGIITMSEAREILADDYCYYCGEKFNSVSEKCFDHMVPMARGGPNVKRNVVVCCGYCNFKKGKKDYREFENIISGQKKARA